ncbi:hypothetical protein [Microbacterium sp. NIBRBAC000506063]|uniref:hypothetical protein n=1 Tax=Microbacterium sp. NIBRBAC000506063 TaxID=2734618 RepID=UPI001BB4FA99|nr:hypothetical protein [Microbacterium sp. NIBRBAC000506063]QTV79674.1 hypothetical protein KAE78_12850 [Microbacterium sp. NIBRBAC000506063]
MRLDVDLEREGVFAQAVQSQLDQRTPVAPIIGTYATDDAVWRYLAAPIQIEGSPTPPR